MVYIKSMNIKMTFKFSNYYYYILVIIIMQLIMQPIKFLKLRLIIIVVTEHLLFLFTFGFSE